MTAITRREALSIAAGTAVAARLGLPAAAWGKSSASFDDGSDVVPGGLVGDPSRVIVIGAGWAGLTLANALRAAGVDHVVLEALDRVGGRANTVDLAGVPMDRGCSWIHQPYGNPMSKWARLAGVRLLNGDVELDLPVIRFFDGPLGREVDLLEKVVPVAHFLNFAENASAEIAQKAGPGLSVRDGWHLYADGKGLSPSEMRRATFMARGFSEMVYGKRWEEMSLAGWSWGNAESTYFGIGEGNFPRGGYRTLYGAMARGGEERLRLGHDVRAVELTGDGVIVRAQAGGRTIRVRGSHVVCTVPLGVLKRRRVHFTPALPAEKTELINQTGFGNIEKVAMVFAEPFWHDLTHTHILHVARGGELAFPWWIDMQRTHRVPALVAFNGGPFARGLHRMTPDQRLASALTQLTEILGRPVPQPLAWTATDWMGDPYACGSYSAMLTGRTPADLEKLAAPVGGRLLFAGEATSRARHATADGAMSSGLREAKRLLRRGAVDLRVG
jgi:polyamine oxidase